MSETTTRDRSKMTSTALAFMERVDRYRKRHPNVSEEDAILKVRADPSIADRGTRSVRRTVSAAAAEAVQPARVELSEPPEPHYARKVHPLVKRSLMFKPIGWFGHWSPHQYTSHLLREISRLGLDIHDIGSQRTDGGNVLHDLLGSMDEGYQDGPCDMYDWQFWNLELLLERRGDRYRDVKPRIDVHAWITSRDNLSVVWYPTNWRNSWGGDRERRCDFTYFNDDAPMFGRPRNELMFIHGVGNLRPGGDDYGSRRYNQDVLDEILICAVRACYEKLIDRLKRAFEVTVRDEFVFETDPHESAEYFSRTRIISWSIENCEQLRRKRDEAELAAVPETYGFTVELFTEHLEQARLTATTANDYTLNERLARRLTKAGHKTTRTRVEHLRKLLERLAPPSLGENVLLLDRQR